MNEDLQIAKKTVQTEIAALKKLSLILNRSNPNPYIRQLKFEM